MKYPDGTNMKKGDRVLISGKYHGTVMVNIGGLDNPNGDWAYLKSGVMIDTDFGGLVHYTEEAIFDEEIILNKNI